jgi:hypothetical protein
MTLDGLSVTGVSYAAVFSGELLEVVDASGNSVRGCYRLCARCSAGLVQRARRSELGPGAANSGAVRGSDTFESGAPVDVLLDPSTGDILSVTAAGPVPAPAISNRSVCDSGDGCYVTNKTPYADEGFYGASGTYDGSWPARSGYSAGHYAVSACWTTSCGPELAAGSKLTFTSDVTGISFTIY